MSTRRSRGTTTGSTGRSSISAPIPTSRPRTTTTTSSRTDATCHGPQTAALPAGRANLNFLLDIFNILDAQRPILLDERWGFVEADNSSPTRVNPNYKKPILRTSPTSFRLGLRVSF